MGFNFQHLTLVLFVEYLFVACVSFLFFFSFICLFFVSYFVSIEIVLRYRVKDNISIW